MATSKTAYRARHPQPPSLRGRDMHFGLYEGPGARLPENILAALLEKDMVPQIGGGSLPGLGTLTVSGYTITSGGTGDAVAASPKGGIRFTFPSDDNFDMTLDSALTFTPTSGKWYAMVARIAMSAVTGLGIKIGISTGGAVAALPFGTDYTDFVGFEKQIADATVNGVARGNSGTEAASSDMGDMVNDTEVEIAMLVYIHATSPQGWFWYNGTRYEFTSAQKTQVAAILTSPPACFWTVHGTGVTATTPTLDLIAFAAGQDN